ncbi:transposase domain-containing protein, partial [Escherichia coli]
NINVRLGSKIVALTKWLRYVIEHIQDWPANRVRDLLPWKVDLTSQ